MIRFRGASGCLGAPTGSRQCTICYATAVRHYRDDMQTQAVAHGSRSNSCSAGDRSVDLQKTRRQSERWQRSRHADRSLARDRERGVDCGIEAYTNRERIAVNDLAREQWRDVADSPAIDVRLETIDGNVSSVTGPKRPPPASRA